MKRDILDVIRRNQDILDYALAILLLILGSILLWDLLLLAFRIGAGVLLIGFAFYLLVRNKEEYRVRFFRF